MVAKKTKRDRLRKGRINGKVEEREMDGENEVVQRVGETD